MHAALVKTVHAGMKITAGVFDGVMQHLGAVLDELDVPKAEQDELVVAPEARGQIHRSRVGPCAGSAESSPRVVPSTRAGWRR